MEKVQKKSVLFFDKEKLFLNYEKSMAKHLGNHVICKYAECLKIINKIFKTKEDRN